ncbi:hypothetical protein [Ruegeria sp. HKCCA5763]|uniref:COG3904 family protein n=1 Tax=Ruegeria sp. HKCCA5763 TaxID=2682987 RepID=UPI00147F1099|nr:hypothetical protein [Ruegeria sp. HKCCA5763]
MKLTTRIGFPAVTRSGRDAGFEQISTKGPKVQIKDLLGVLALLVLLVQPAWSKEMTFDIIYANHSNYVVADGEITSDTPNVFREFLNSEPFDGFTFYIDLNSRGGSLFGGMALGKMIREQGLIARVVSYRQRTEGDDYWRPKEEPGICMSACALAFLGGESRELRDDSILGFHQFSSAANAAGQVADVYETEVMTQTLSGIVHSYISSMGISPDLFSRMSMTIPEEMYIPTFEELTSFNILPADAFSNFTLEPYGEGVFAYATFPGNVEGRNIIGKVSVFCRAEVPFLLLSLLEDQKQIDERTMGLAQEMVSGFSLWAPPGKPKLEYPPQNVRFYSNSHAVAEIQIDSRGVDLLSGEAKGVVRLPGALGISMYFHLRPNESDKRLMRSAFQLCISGEQPEDEGRSSVKDDLVDRYNAEGIYKNYLAGWSLPNTSAMRAMENAYSSKIEFYGSMLSKTALLKEKQKFAERWPNRDYTARDGSFDISCSGDLCVVAAMIDWFAHSPDRGKTARGVAWYELGFDTKTGQIVFENGESRKE